MYDYSSSSKHDLYVLCLIENYYMCMIDTEENEPTLNIQKNFTLVCRIKKALLNFETSHSDVVFDMHYVLSMFLCTLKIKFSWKLIL